MQRRNNICLPIEEDNPFSAYAVVVYMEGIYIVYPESTNISGAAAGVLEILDIFKAEGLPADYNENVRLVSYQAQMDAPNVTMRRLKKAMFAVRFYKKAKTIKMEAKRLDRYSQLVESLKCPIYQWWMTTYP